MFEDHVGQMASIDLGEPLGCVGRRFVAREEWLQRVVITPVHIGEVGREVRNVDTLRDGGVDAHVLVRAVALRDLPDTCHPAVPVARTGDGVDGLGGRRHRRRGYRPLASLSGRTAV